MFIVRLFTISRGSAYVPSMSHLYLSLSIGLLLILHSLYYTPLLTNQSSFSLYSLQYSLLAHGTVKLVVFWLLKHGMEGQMPRQKWLSRKIDFLKLIYASVIKWCTYLNLIMMLTVVKYLSFSIAVICSLFFLLFLQLGSINNRISRVMNKGRSFSTNNLKTVVIIMLTIISIALQPIEYEFSKKLHFQIFIIFTFSLLVFSYSYLHKLAFAITVRQTALNFIFQESCVEWLCVGCVIGYNLLMGDNGIDLAGQFTHFYKYWHLLLGIMVLSIMEQIILVQFFKKISYCRILITKATGFLWFNVYSMVRSNINMLQYVSVMLMLVVLLVSVELLSQQRVKVMMQAVFRSKSRSRRRSVLHQQSQMKQGQLYE